MGRTLKIVLVDDEPLALASLAKSLADCEDILVIATFQNGREAAAQIPDLKPDVVFLDIQMPGMNGLQVAQALMSVACLDIVFVTAFSEHAVHAFRVNAINYILKPYEDEQITETIARVRKNRGDPLPVVAKLLDFLEAFNNQPSYTNRFLVKEGQRSFIVQTDEITWISGARNYVELHTPHKTYLYRQTLNQLEAELDPAKFIRIHRSKMVNLNELVCIEKPAKNQIEVITRDGCRHPVSNGYRLDLEAALKH